MPGQCKTIPDPSRQKPSVTGVKHIGQVWRERVRGRAGRAREGKQGEGEGQQEGESNLLKKVSIEVPLEFSGKEGRRVSLTRVL